MSELRTDYPILFFRFYVIQQLLKKYNLIGSTLHNSKIFGNQIV